MVKEFFKTITLGEEPDETILLLKSFLIVQQKLAFKKYLKDNITSANYNFQKEANIYLVLRLRG